MPIFMLLLMLCVASGAAEWPAYSHDQCIGDLVVQGLESNALVRNTGGGSAPCCSMHPVAAPARVHGRELMLELQPLEAGKTVSALKTRV